MVCRPSLRLSFYSVFLRLLLCPQVHSYAFVHGFRCPRGLQVAMHTASGALHSRSLFLRDHSSSGIFLCVLIFCRPSATCLPIHKYPRHCIPCPSMLPCLPCSSYTIKQTCMFSAGAGEPNYDSMVANPYASLKERREQEVSYAQDAMAESQEGAHA